ncbi:hypothetical protein CASFOL_005883 [Castilleja foliolosa]|uniref:Uncharacterized protein n=1 Tax=Castilleja foliolosa TaxID=1961234 RepID=A0ABD3E8P8_9LAMI
MIDHRWLTRSEPVTKRRLCTALGESTAGSARCVAPVSVPAYGSSRRRPTSVEVSEGGSRRSNILVVKWHRSLHGSDH